MSIFELLNEISWLPFYFYILFVPTSIFLWRKRPKKKYNVCKIIFFSIWVVFCYYLIPHPIVLHEELSDLHERSGVLKYIQPKGKRTEGFYFYNNDGTYDELNFELCNKNLNELKQYNDKIITIWYKHNWVYQMAYNGEVIYDVKESNRRSIFVTVSNLNLFISLFFVYLSLYLYIIIDMEKERKDDQ